MSRIVLATLWILALAAAPPCFGVSLGANGLGQVLIYPYYSVRLAPGIASPYNALLLVVNGAPRGKAVKVRFREALAGAPVFEATVFLSLRREHDVDSHGVNGAWASIAHKPPDTAGSRELGDADVRNGHDLGGRQRLQRGRLPPLTGIVHPNEDHCNCRGRA